MRIRKDVILVVVVMMSGCLSGPGSPEPSGDPGPSGSSVRVECNLQKMLAALDQDRENYEFFKFGEAIHLAELVNKGVLPESCLEER